MKKQKKTAQDELASPISCKLWGHDLLCSCPKNTCDISNVIDIDTGKAYAGTITGLYLHAQSWTRGTNNKPKSTISKIVISDYDKLSHLTALDLSYNNITSEGLADLTKLTLLSKIQLDSNNLTRLPSLSGLTNLTFITFSINKIYEIPEDAFKDQQQAMQRIDLSNNKITTLPATVFSSLVVATDGITDFYLTCNQLSLSSLTAIKNINNLTDIGALGLCGNPDFPGGTCKNLGLTHEYQCFEGACPNTMACGG